MLSFIKSRWVLLLVITLFILFKIHNLFYPYYWDESWPYASAVSYMFHHGISLVPGAVDPNLSRGHPLLFHAAAALWGKIFGMSHVSMHSFALTISMLFLIAIYETSSRLFNKRVAIMSLLLVATQVLFIIQSTFLLLEMLVALLALLSLYHYIKGNHLQTGIYLSMLFLTKESGLIMGFVLGVDALISLRKITITTKKEHLRRLLSIGVPCILMVTFFLLQKRINGWYILPLYKQLADRSWSNFWEVFSKEATSCMFISDYRSLIFITAIAVTIYSAIAKKMYGLLTILIPTVLIYFMTGDQGPTHSRDSLLHFTALILSLASFSYYISRPSLFKSAGQRKFILLTLAFITCFSIFSSMNFFTYRYLLAIIIPGLMLVAIITDKMTALTRPTLYYVMLIVMMGINTYAYIYDDGNGDTDRSAFANMELQQCAVDYLEQHGLYNASIGAGSYLNRVHLTDPATGFLHGSQTFTNVNWEIDYRDYIIVDNIEADYRYDHIKQLQDYQLVLRAQKGMGWIEIYARTKK